MKARLLRREPEGVVVVESAGVEVRAIDRLARSKQPAPEAGAEFEASFSYQLEQEPRLLPADTTEPTALRSNAGVGAEAVGQILCIDSESPDRRVMVVLVDCGGVVLPSPIDVSDPALIGRRVAFAIAELEVWQG